MCFFQQYKVSVLQLLMKSGNENYGEKWFISHVTLKMKGTSEVTQCTVYTLNVISRLGEYKLYLFSTAFVTDYVL